MLVMAYSTPRSVMRPFESSLESSSASAKAILLNLSVGTEGRSRTREVNSGVMIRQGAQADVVNSARRSVFEAEQVRR